MNPTPSSWLFSVSEAPVEVPVPTSTGIRRVRIPYKKALIAEDTREVVGIVGKAYRVVTNHEALELCRKLCIQVFPGSSPSEWELSDAAGPKSRSRVALDLKHKTHLMNLWDNEGGVSDVHTPFLRVTNSYNGRRALRFDLGFMRSHCSNGVIFEEKVATVSAAHTKEAIAGLDLAGAVQNFGGIKQRFLDCLKTLRSIALTDRESLELVRLIVALPRATKDMPESKRSEIAILEEGLSNLDARHRTELGANAYATFNTMTDFATRPPASFLIRRDRSSLQSRSGSWLKDIHQQAGQTQFHLPAYLAAMQVRYGATKQGNSGPSLAG